MKTGMFSIAVFFLLLSHGRTLFAQGPYPIPLRINMGHFENVDSRGRTCVATTAAMLTRWSFLYQSFLFRARNTL